jgi:hypothetical protein
MENNFTTQPVAVSCGADPEWTDWRGLKNMFSIGRSAGYTHIENGDFRSKVLRRKGCIKGRRIIEVASVREFIAKQSDEVDPALSAKCKEANKASQKAKREKEKPKPKGK